MTPDDIFLAAFHVRPGRTPARSRINHLLKYARSWGIECLGFADPAEIEALRQEVVWLRRLLADLVDAWGENPVRSEE
jgi:hypothetical protein